MGQGMLALILIIVQIKILYMKNIIIFSIALIFTPLLSNSQVIDIEGNSYDTVQVGKQVWLKQNIRSKKYSDGKDVSVNNFKCVNGDCQRTDSFGLIYNFKGLTREETGERIQGICPKDYSIPTRSDWHELMLFLKADTTWLWKTAYNNVAQKLMDSTYSPLSRYPFAGECTNESGLSILPSGIYFKDNYYNFLNSAHIRIFENNQHFGVTIVFSRSDANTVNLTPYINHEAATADYSYSSCRCIKSSKNVNTNDHNASTNFIISPNPSMGKLLIKVPESWSNANTEFKVFSLNGKIVLEDFLVNEKEINLFIPSGLYIFQLKQQSKATKFIKLVMK